MLKEKLDLWIKITGVNPTEDRRAYTIKFSGISDWDIERMNDRIQEALSYDETGYFAEAYLDTYFTKYLKEKSISLFELITNPQSEKMVADITKLYQSLKESNVESSIMDSAKKAMDFYGFPSDELSLFDVIELRTSATNCINGKLKTVQLSSGSVADDFKLSQDIFMYESLDSLVYAASTGQVNGVSLAYIRNEQDITDSYFTFVIKNGDNLYLLSDMPEYVHPLQSGMKRCPGRDMSNRIESNWFPYDSVANIDISDLWGSGRYGTSEKDNSLSEVIKENAFVKIGNFQMMSQEEIFWTVVMVSFIEEKFYKNEVPRLPISYVGSMVKSNMIPVTETALVVQNSLPSISVEEISIENTKGLKYGYKKDKDEANGYYDYLIDRYKDKIDTSVLNFVSGTDKAKVIEEKYVEKDYWGKVISHDYAALDLSSPHTKEEIEYNQKWIVRYNYAKAVNRLIKEDYNENWSNLYETIKSMLSNRLEDLVVMHMQNKLKGFRVERKNFDEYYTTEETDISSLLLFDKWYGSYTRVRYYFGGENAYNKADYRCALSGEKPGIAITIKPRNAKELAMVCGCDIEGLPEQLRHYETKDRYYGNPLLDNIDPFDWIFKDKFNEMDFDMTILISKKKYLELCVKAGIEPVKFWLNEKPNCFRKCNKCPEKCDGQENRKWKGYSFTYSLSKKCEKCKWYKEFSKEK